MAARRRLLLIDPQMTHAEVYDSMTRKAARRSGSKASVAVGEVVEASGIGEAIVEGRMKVAKIRVTYEVEFLQDLGPMKIEKPAAPKPVHPVAALPPVPRKDLWPPTIEPADSTSHPPAPPPPPAPEPSLEQPTVPEPRWIEYVVVPPVKYDGS